MVALVNDDMPEAALKLLKPLGNGLDKPHGQAFPDGEFPAAHAPGFGFVQSKEMSGAGRPLIGQFARMAKNECRLSPCRNDGQGHHCFPGANGQNHATLPPPQDGINGLYLVRPQPAQEFKIHRRKGERAVNDFMRHPMRPENLNQPPPESARDVEALFCLAPEKEMFRDIPRPPSGLHRVMIGGVPHGERLPDFVADGARKRAFQKNIVGDVDGNFHCRFQDGNFPVYGLLPVAGLQKVYY
jgi:hypothetical protein